MSFCGCFCRTEFLKQFIGESQRCKFEKFQVFANGICSGNKKQPEERPGFQVLDSERRMNSLNRVEACMRNRDVRLDENSASFITARQELHGILGIWQMQS